MSLRTIQRTAILSVLALGALSASGCDDDETKSETDAGDNGGDNNNNNNNGDVDAGEVDAGGPKPLMCDNSDDACTDNNLGGITLKACCTEGADVCGLDTSVLAAVGVPFAGCYERAAPGVASEFCGGFFDMIDVKDGDKQFNLSIAQRMLDAATGFCAELTDEQREAAIKFSPCCTPTGECGVFIDNVEFMGSFNLDLGCVAASELMPAPEENPVCTNNPATARRPTTLPYCNADSGAGQCPEKLTAAICGPLSAAGVSCTVGNTTPDWVCTQFGLPKAGATTPPTLDPATYCMEGVPEVVSGCGPTPGARCIPNIPKNIWGCDAVAAGSPLLAALPEYLCGCGKKMPAAAEGLGALCIGGADPAVCGGTVITSVPSCPSADLLCNAVPNILCGCGDGAKTFPAGDFATLPCLKNVPQNVCGQKAQCTGLFPMVDSCPAADQCLDAAPFPIAKDGIGDTCGCSANAPNGAGGTLDTCNPTGAAANTAAGSLSCVGPATSPHCSCGTIDAQGRCEDGKLCKDSNADGVGDSCLAPT